MSKLSKHVLPQYGFRERYLTWQLGDISPHSASVLGTARFIILAIMIVTLIIFLIYIPEKLGYYW